MTLPVAMRKSSCMDRRMTGGDFASDTVRGQYAGYLDEEGVPAESLTETFAVLKLYCDNWRWQGVPYLRSGKGMSCRTTQIVIQSNKCRMFV